ncbi:MAG TPA: lipoyl(octanoyl) transferase LipB [Burkholderiales bacterium]|nr:lipoyl(octanoyl) transferase LipB [Burkholderiales bacterium]
MSAVLERIVVKQLGQIEYQAALRAMKSFSSQRKEATPDELWLVEHPAVYTLGQGAKEVVVSNGIPLVKSDRGGEITYHGPGQVVLYALIDLARRGIKVKQFVALLEQSVIDLVGPRAERKAGAPGVYVGGAKLAALGIRVARGRSYHGLALNVDMDLAPFGAIDPCGFPGLAVTQMKHLGFSMSMEETGKRLAGLLAEGIENA